MKKLVLLLVAVYGALSLEDNITKYIDQTYSFESINYPQYRIGVKDDTTAAILLYGIEKFTVVKALNGRPDSISLQSVKDSKKYLRHHNFILKLHPLDLGSEFYKNDSSFIIREDKYYPGYVSFESTNYPGYFLRHQSYTLKLNVEEPLVELYQKDASFRLVQLGDSYAGKQYSFQSNNYPLYRIGVRDDGVAAILLNSTDGFRVVQALNGRSDSVSLQSVKDKTKYLRHHDFILKLHQVDFSSNLYKNDASFIIRLNYYYPGFISFESTNYPGFFLRHQGYFLKLNKEEPLVELYRRDASFKLVEFYNKDEYILISTDAGLELAHQSIEKDCLKLYVSENLNIDYNHCKTLDHPKQSANQEQIKNLDQYHCETSDFQQQSANQDQINNHEQYHCETLDCQQQSAVKEQIKNHEQYHSKTFDCQQQSANQEQVKNHEACCITENASNLEPDLSSELIEKFTELFGFHPSLLVSSSKKAFEKLQHEVKNIKFCTIDDIKKLLNEYSSYFDIQFALKNVQTFFQQLTVQENNSYTQDRNIDNPIMDHIESKEECNNSHLLVEFSNRGDNECEQNAECGGDAECRYLQIQPNCDMAVKDSFLNNFETESKIDKALNQMEAMGFDIEDKTLRQLLIGNDCSIEKVLDSMDLS